MALVLGACGGGSTLDEGAKGTPPRSAGTRPTAAAAGWTTYHHDPARTGVDVSSPPAGKLAQAWSHPVDGAIYAEPLVLGSVVYVATEQDTVYALDVRDGHERWARHLADPVEGAALPCGNIDPSGITGTPVIDVASRTIDVVAFESPAEHVLFALDLGDGSLVWRRPADPAGADPAVEQQRGALTIAGGRVEVPYGGLYGDCGDYHGWMVGFRTDGRGPVSSFRVPNEREAGIWAPPGATTAPDGSLLVATGNGTSSQAFADSDSVIRLRPTLAATDVFAPTNWAELNEGDLDLGTTSPAVVGAGLVFQVGKQGIGYLLRLDHLGGVGGQLHAGHVCRSAYGGTAVVGSTVYVSCIDGLHAVQVHAGAEPSFSVTRAGSEHVGPPIVSGGVVWTVGVEGTLYGFDRTTGRLRYRFHLGEVATSFPRLAASAGRLFVPAGSSLVCYRGV